MSRHHYSGRDAATSYMSAVPGRQRFSDWSSPAVDNSLWFASDFMTGAGIVIIQPATEKVLLVFESEKKYWFLPKGRKDIGESVEQTALREAYEESGYRAKFLPLLIPTRAPAPLNDPDATNRLNTEPIMVSTYAWAPRKATKHHTADLGGEHITYWFVGQIPEDAEHDEDTGMADEKDFIPKLLSYEEAQENLKDNLTELRVVQTAWYIWKHTLKTHRRDEPDAVVTGAAGGDVLKEAAE